TTLGVFHYVPDFESVDTDVDEVEEYLYDYWEADYNAVLYIDGVESGYVTAEEDLQDIVDVLDRKDVLGKGVQVEIYVTEETIFVVVINTYIGKIVKINKPKNTVTIGDEYGETIEAENEWGFGASDLDEVALFWLCDEDRSNAAQNVHDIEIIEPVTATVTRADVDGKGNHSFVADGETYEYAHTFGQWLSAIMMDDDHNFYSNGNKEHDIYLDKNGYVMYHEWTEQDNTEIVVIDGDSWKSSGRWENSDGHQYEVNEADFIYFEEGAPAKTVETTWDFNKTLNHGKGNNADILAWVAYLEDDEMAYLAAEDYTQNIAATAQATIQLRKNKVTTGGSSAETRDHLFNDDTQFIVRIPDYFGEDEHDSFTYLYFNGIGDIDANYEANEFQYFLDDQCGMKGEGRFYAYVYVDATYALETNTAFILRSAGSSVLKLENGRVMGGDKFEAIVNGEEAIVVYEHGAHLIADMSDDIDLDGDGVTDFVPAMVKSKYVLLGWTLDDVPVWAYADVTSANITANSKPDFMIDGSVLSWDMVEGEAEKWNGIRLDPDCAVWVSYPNKKGEFIAELVEQEDFNEEYVDDLGWAVVKAHCWAFRLEDEVGYKDDTADFVMIVLVPAE
ncbi:MAG: hypothetical protein J6J43_06520, partial [Oscillospiraceae bacterium]|nr:hypothetical protein [Oscillospiraceae bacterium]